MTVRLTGDWDKAQRITRGMAVRYKRAMDTAVMAEAQFLRAKMIEGIREQAPGGRRFKPLAASTLRARSFRKRGGTKALIQSGLLRNSISVKKIGNAVFVGVQRTAKDGRANIAQMNEFGHTIVAKLTPASLRFLHAISGKEGGSGTGVARSPSGGGIGIVIIRIPPRPFAGPVAEKYAKPALVIERFKLRLAVALATP